MKKVLIIVGLVLGFALCAVATFFVTNYFHNKETEQMTSQIATLNSNLEAIGPVVPCYTVQSATFPGQELTEDNIIKQSIPQNLKNDTSLPRKISSVCIARSPSLLVLLLRRTW